MEKYAIDLDKVLDEFEEKEALTADIDRSEEPKRIKKDVSDNYNIPSYLGEKLQASFKEKESVLPNSTKHEYSNPTSGIFNDCLITENDNHTLSENRLFFNNKTELISETGLLDCNNGSSVSEIQKNAQLNVCKNSNYLKFDTNFKTNTENTKGFGFFTDCEGNSSKSQTDEKKDSSEGVLCTPAKESDSTIEKSGKLPLENINGFDLNIEFETDYLSNPTLRKNLKEENNLTSQNAELALTTTIKTNNLATNQEMFENSFRTFSNNVSDNNICKDSTSINEEQEVSIDFNKDKIIEQSVVCTGYINNLLSNTLIKNENPVSLDCTETNCCPETYSSNNNDSKLRRSNVIEPLLSNNAGENLPDKLPFNEHVSESWKMTNGVNAFDSKVSSNFSQDDDSGVSSQEDISSNSPSELPLNQSPNSTNRKSHPCHKTISKLTSLQNGASNVFNEFSDKEKPVSFINESSYDDDISESNCDKLQFLQTSTIGKDFIDISQDVNSGAEVASLKIDQNTSPDLSIKTSEIEAASEIKNCTENLHGEDFVCVPSFNSNSEMKDNSSVSKMLDAVQLSNSLEIEKNSNFNVTVCELVLPDNDNKTVEIPNCEVKNDKSFCQSVPVNKLNQDKEILSNFTDNNMENECNVIEIVSKFSDTLECEQVDICEKSVDENISSEITAADDEIKYSEVSPRLQRPTSLNLPSLQFHSSEIPDEKQFSESSDQLIEGSVSSTIPVEEPVVDNPCIKQQQQIGFIKPYWIPDNEAFNCMHCALKFTVIRRRHHCRACGKVLCSRCCNQRAYLAYMNKEDRICQPCAEVLSSNNALALSNEQMPSSSNSPNSNSCGSSPNFSPSSQVSSFSVEDKTAWRPHPNNPDDYCSTIPPLQQMELTGQKPPPTVMVPIGVLKRGNKRRREPKQVIFSDGIRPGGDLTDLTEPVESAPFYRRTSRKRVDKIFSENSKETGGVSSAKGQQKYRQKKVLISDEDGPLPPIILQHDLTNEDNVEWSHILQLLLDEEQKPVKFSVMKNLHILVKLVKLDCCFGKECWCFTSDGFCSVGQDEVMIILERNPDETKIPRDMFKIFTHIYDNASKGSIIEELGHTIFPNEILESSDHRGFLFVRPSFQCLSKLTVPTTPYLVGILIHKWEVPWAKVFPLRLMLRLGAECRYYPCSLVSVRNRKPVFFEIGQTIMNVLADLRNYQFTIPVVSGLVVHMEEKRTYVNIPRNRYEKVMKVLKSNNVEHVLALGSNFSTEADSHLVCMQKEEGDYQTQAINIENTTRRVTGASFIVFSGALKSTSGLTAKFSIVEDGLLIQISQETMMALHVALRDMKDLTIECGHVGASEPDEIVIIQWTRDDKRFNLGVRSPIDGKSFEGVSSLRIHTSTDYAGENYLIRWTEVFFLDVEESGNSIQNELVDPCRLAETVAQSCCMALTPFLDQLADSELLKIGLRVTLDTENDKVGYDIGARGKTLPSAYMTALDNSLIPVILRLSNVAQKEKLSFELIFHILVK